MASPPSILSDISQSSAGIEALSRLQHVCYVGGPLSEHVGKTLAPKLKHLWSFFGATEYGFFHTIAGGSDKAQYVKFNPDVGYRFDEISPGIYEHVIPNDPATRKYHGTPYTFPDLNEYRMKDLYSMAPCGDGWMRYEGRRDDLIVLSNGEKINPLPLEAIINDHPAVSAAVIVGEYRFLPCLLIELKAEFSEQREKMLEAIWPTIENANTEAPRFSRIAKSLTYILPPAEAFARAGKGTIQRQATVKKFATQVEQLYSNAELGLLAEGLGISDATDIESIQDLINRLFCQVLDVETLNFNDDVFELGMDSLQVAIAVQKLKASLRAGHVEIDYGKLGAHLFYASPSVAKLAFSLHGLVNGQHGTDRAAHDHHARLQKMLDRHLVEPDVVRDSQKKKLQSDNITVILTGSTGSLGNYLLTALLSSPKISKIICLNRTADAEKRQRTMHRLKELSTSLWDDPTGNSRVEFLTTDLSKENLGLDEKTYTRLLSEAGVIVHCAWNVNFNQTLETFDSQIAGVLHLIDLAKRATSLVSIMFVSSISSVVNWIQNHPGQVVPENMIHDLDAPEHMGYGESKYIGERLLEASGVPSAVLRVGQVAGPVRSQAGSWNPQEWFPSLVTSSKYLGMLPASLGSMDSINWVPVDILATIMMQLLDVLNDETQRELCTVYNVVNPRLARWSSLLPVVQTQLGGASKIRTTSMAEWTEALERSMGDNFGYVTDENPAVKLLEFYKSLANATPQSLPELESEWEVQHLTRDSPEAVSLKAVSPDWIRIWMKQWGF
jgi:thioester reductase-like protein